MNWFRISQRVEIASMIGLVHIALLGTVPAASAAGLTGTRIYHVYAKSWINIDAITESTWLARKIHVSGNDEPQDARNTERNDCKLYQSFGVEVQFVDGRIVRTAVVDRIERAGKTFGLRGEIRGPEPTVEFSSDKSAVVVTRQVEGNPNMIVLAADIGGAEAAIRSLGVDLSATKVKPYNTLRLQVTASGATASCQGSGFPSHYCWIQEGSAQPRLFARQAQVQPSQFFETLEVVSNPQVGGPLTPVTIHKPRPPVEGPAVAGLPVVLPPTAEVNTPQRLPEPAGPITITFNEIAARACAAPDKIGPDWLSDGRYERLPTGAAVQDDRSARLPRCVKEVFLELLRWNARRIPPRLDSSWLRDVTLLAVRGTPSTAPPFGGPGGPCGRRCSSEAPTNGRGLRNWCIQSCGCRGYDSKSGQCVP